MSELEANKIEITICKMPNCDNPVELPRRVCNQCLGFNETLTTYPPSQVPDGPIMETHQIDPASNQCPSTWYSADPMYVCRVCGEDFQAWRNGKQWVRKKCKACSTSGRLKTVHDKIFETGSILKDPGKRQHAIQNKVKRGQIKLASDGPIFPTFPIPGDKKQSAFVIDFLGRERLLAKLHRLAHDSFRTPQQWVLWMIDQEDDPNEPVA
jgi:hypothetical protein